MASERTKKFLELFEQATENVGGAERALYLLLFRWEESLPEFDDYFHKAFRQCDIIDDGHKAREARKAGTTDMVFWHLIDSSKLFWKVFEKVQKIPLL